MLVEFVKDLPVGIKNGEVKDLPVYLAQYHIEKGDAQLINASDSEEKVKVKKVKSKQNDKN